VLGRFETRVAMVTLGDGPGFLLAEHLEGDAPVLVERTRPERGESLRGRRDF
jgi:hypothetical protein